MGITKVVYYMDPLMSTELLPDKSSAFDFNYSQSQSSIWSPLVPRVHSAIDLDFEFFGFVTPKRKSLGSKSKIKKVTSNIKKKLKVAANLVKSKANNNNINTKASEFYPSPLKPTTKACWTKALKAGSKNFKKTRKDPTAHVKLYTYLMSENI